MIKLCLLPLMALSVMSTATHASSTVVLRFEVHPVMSGAQPWDGTGINSAQLDGGGGGLFDLAKQAMLDQTNLRMAPPDPYICFVFDATNGLVCDRSTTLQNTVQFEYTLDLARTPERWYGVALVDSDVGNPFGGDDDLIGYGVVIDEDTYAAVLAGDADALAVAREAERLVTDVMMARFGTDPNFLGGGRRHAAKLAPSKCEYGCSFGDAQIVMSSSVDGW